MPDPVSDAAAVADLLARDRRDGDPALRAAAAGRTVSYRDLCTTAYRAGNALAHLGVRRGDRVAVEPSPSPEPILTFLGATLLGARTEFRADAGSDARVVLAHVDREGEFDLPPGTRLLAFDGPPGHPTTTRWESTVSSENPAFPPTEYDPEAAVLDAGEDSLAHRALLDAARDVAGSFGLDGESRVVVRSSFADPRTVVAGVVAPLLVGGSIQLPDDDGGSIGTDDGGSIGTIAVTDGGDATEDRTIPIGEIRP